MKFKIDQQVLTEGLLKVEHALSNKTIIPILNCVKFDLQNEGLYLTAMDTDFAIQTFIPNDNTKMQISSIGTILVTKSVLEFVKKIDKGILEISVEEDNKILIKSNSGKCEFNGYNIKEFPDKNLNAFGKKIIINTKEFKDKISQIIYASGTDEGRQILTGVNFNLVGDRLELNATDSYRLARNVIILNKEKNPDLDQTSNIVISSKNISTILKIININENLEMYLLNNKVLFKNENLTAETSLINGNYPNTHNLTSSLTNENIICKFTLNKNVFINVIDRVSIFTSDKEKNVIKLQASTNKINIKSANEQGKIVETIDLVEEINQDISIGFSSKFMLDCIKSLKNDTLTISIYGSNKPIIITDRDNTDYLSLIVPII